MSEINAALSLLEDLEQNVEKIARTYKLHEVLNENDYTNISNKENINPFKEPLTAQKRKKGELVSCIKQQIPFQDMTTPMIQKIEKKKKRKLSFKSTPIVYTITDDYETPKEDIGLSIEDTDIVSNFLNIKNSCNAPAHSMKQFEEQFTRHQNPAKDNVMDEAHKIESYKTERISHLSEEKRSKDSMVYNQEEFVCQKEKLQRLKLEQEQLIKQTYLLQDIQMPGIMRETEYCKHDTELSIEELDISPTENMPLYVNRLKKSSKLTKQRDENVDASGSPKRTNDLWSNIELLSHKDFLNQVKSPSSLIIQNVLNTSFEVEVKDIKHGSLSNDSKMDNALEWNLNVGRKLIPDPTTSYFGHCLTDYLPYLCDKEADVKLFALSKIKALISGNSKSASIYFKPVVDAIVLCLEIFEKQEYNFNLIALDILSEIGNNAEPSLQVLIKILKNPEVVYLYEQVLETILSIGVTGLSSLLRLCFNASSEFDLFVLTYIANHPLIQENVIVPELIKECQSTDSGIRTQAVKSILKFNFRSIKPLNTLVNLLISGSVNRKLVAEAIKSCGEEGEKVLLSFTQSKNPIIRACSAYIMGKRLEQDRKLTVVANADMSLFNSLPYIMFCLDNEYLLFDPQKLVSSIARGIESNIYETMDQVEYKIEPHVRQTLILISNQKRLRNDLLQNTFPSYTFIHSLQMVKEANISSKICDNMNSEAVENCQREKAQTMINLLSHDCALALSNLLADNDDSVKITAADSIANIGLPEAEIAITPLCNLLNDRSNKVRANALKSFVILAPQISKKLPKDVPKIVKSIVSLLKDSHFNVRIAAVSTLTSFSNSIPNKDGAMNYAIPLLLKILKDGSATRNEVAKCLVSIGDKGVLQLLNLMNQGTQTNIPIRVSAAYGLSLIDICSAYVEKVVECLYNFSRDRTPLIRRAAIASLGTLIQRGNSYIRNNNIGNQMPFLNLRSFLSFLYEFLKDRDKSIREIAAEILASLGPHGEFLLIEGLLKDSNSLIRASAAYGVKHVGPRAIRTLLLALYDKDISVIQSAMSAIESMETSLIVKALRERPLHQRLSFINSAKEMLSSTLIPSSNILRVNLTKVIEELKTIRDSNGNTN